MLWICKSCGTAYSVGAPKCPHDGATEYVEEGSPEHAGLIAEKTIVVGESGPEIVTLAPGSKVKKASGA